MKDYTSENPNFSEIIKILESSDPAHADIINQAIKQIFQNTMVLKDEVDAQQGVIDNCPANVTAAFNALSAAAYAQMITSYADLMANTMSGHLVDALTIKEGVSGTLLWENPNVAVAFAGQTINLDLADFRRLSVVFKLSTTINEYIECTARKGIKNTCNFPFSSGDTYAPLMVQRYVSFIDDYISISNTIYTSINVKPTASNNYCIPVKIYGYKTD